MRFGLRQSAYNRRKMRFERLPHWEHTGLFGKLCGLHHTPKHSHNGRKMCFMSESYFSERLVPHTLPRRSVPDRQRNLRLLQYTRSRPGRTPCRFLPTLSQSVGTQPCLLCRMQSASISGCFRHVPRLYGFDECTHFTNGGLCNMSQPFGFIPYPKQSKTSVMQMA